MTDSTVTIEVDGRELQAKPGTMLIEVTDAAGITVPRFCYHKKLSISANCRMCLVEVEKVPKPLPACATPVTDGMKVFTRSPRALAAQKGTMEFLLINHPLDCPICDQGGECELQDVAMGYGSDVSRYAEGKRVVADKNIGPLIATDMTRCIHCTRCVRFGQEIAGIREMGATGRGEHMTIGTYIERSIDSELSGNIIDLCPVGALTSKPFRFSARAWELTQVEGIAPHDSVGSNINLHLRGNKVMRVHPRDNESLNESWISDRDRYSYEGLYADDRLTAPMIKKDGEWQETSWEMALEMAAAGLREIEADQIGALVSPSSTLEELYLAQKLMRGLGSNHIDSRLRQGDFRQDDAGSGISWLGMKVADLETLNSVLVVGGNLRKEQPILGHRLRKAALAGAGVNFLNPCSIELNYSAKQKVVGPAEIVDALAAVAKASGAKGEGATAELIQSASADDDAKAVAEALKKGGKAAVILGAMAQSHPDYALLVGLASAAAEATGAILSIVPVASNSVGAQLAGAVPTLEAGGKAAANSGLDMMKLLKMPRKGYLLMGVEPGLDFWDGALSVNALQSADTVVALTAYRSPQLESCADILLPMGVFAETAGTYVNGEGGWQSSRGVVKPQGQARPGWKILRVLGNLLDVEGFEYIDADQVKEELRALCNDDLPPNQGGNLSGKPARQLIGEGLLRGGDTPLYSIDPLVRRAAALQQTLDAGNPAVRLHPAEAEKLGLNGSDLALVKQNGYQANLPLQLDESLPEGCAWISTGLAETASLGQPFGEVTVEKA
ncbi:MAG: NADH-quinone oxidoreductase subunit NuoG [Candidatus Thiodiazotropha sp. (ex Monitilora ramsayi)]|nr:NADH-quinone oxidoreductase subunit NuoG [Candidatus Thiodiazotropha sp. (ex Monitilora ramsayi)]